MRGKRFIVMGAVAAIVALALPAQAAHAGTVKITAPRAGFVHGDTASSWTWTAGSLVRSTSKVDVTSISSTGERKAIATAVPISRKSATWATSGVADDTYAVEIRVRGTKLRSSFGGIVVDNTAPALQLLRPAPGEVIVDDLSVFGSSPMPVVLGSATFAAAAADKGSGLASLSWLLDGVPIGSGPTVVQDFSERAGWHTVAVRATDVLGNTSEATQSFFGGPGALAASQKAPAQPGQQQGPEPGPQPGPSVPGAGPLPTPTAGLVPQPLPPIPVGPSPIPTPSSVGELAEWLGMVVADEIAATINPLLWRANATCGQIGMQGCQPGSGGGGGGGVPCSDGTCVPPDPTGCASAPANCPLPQPVKDCLASPAGCTGNPPQVPPEVQECVNDPAGCPGNPPQVPPEVQECVNDPAGCPGNPPQVPPEVSDCLADQSKCPVDPGSIVPGQPDLVDTVFVNSADNGTTNHVLLEQAPDENEDGIPDYPNYQFVASGTYRFDTLGDPTGSLADAECSSQNGDAWQMNTFEAQFPGLDLLDVIVDGGWIGWTPVTDNGSGCDTTDHEYTFDYFGTGGLATFKVVDADSTTNVGVIRIDIFKAPPDPQQAAVLGDPVASLAGGFIVGGFAWIADLRRRRLLGRRPEAR